MAVTYANFVADFPEFANQANYPPRLVAHWLSIAKLLLNPAYWDDTAGDDGRSILGLGTELFAAHWLVLGKRAVDASKNPANAPGQVNGMVSGKSVGPVSMSYDTSAVMRKDATHWNLTTYGIQFIHFVDIMGAGPIQIGVGFDPLGWFNGPAWIGPWPFPSITGFG